MLTTATRNWQGFDSRLGKAQFQIPWAQRNGQPINRCLVLKIFSKSAIILDIAHILNASTP
jgi:hypothetical protein